MTVTLMPNLTRAQAYETTVALCNTLESYGVSYNFIQDDEVSARFTNAEFVDEADMSAVTDIIIAVGGDGTMTRAAKLALPLDIPVLGVNAGNLAYLMGLEANELQLLEKLILGDYFSEEQLVLQIDVYDEENKLFFTDYCINDAVFARGELIKLARLDFYCDDRFINRYSADGLIIATPTGSTAYNLAAGGPIVDPRIESILLSPICPHSLSERTILFSGNSVLKIVNPDNNISSILFSCDGQDSMAFKKGYAAKIKKADKKVKFIRLKDDTFLDILHKKMRNQ